MTFRSGHPSLATHWFRYTVAASTLIVLLGACTCGPVQPTASANIPVSPGALTSVSAKTLLQTLSSWDGKGLRYPAGTPQVTALEIVVAPGAQTGWHRHPVPSLAYILEGELEVSLSDGTQRRFGAGQAVAEVVDTVHNGRNPGSVNTRLVVFYLGAVGEPLTVATPR